MIHYLKIFKNYTPVDKSCPRLQVTQFLFSVFGRNLLLSFFKQYFPKSYQIGVGSQRFQVENPTVVISFFRCADDEIFKF